MIGVPVMLQSLIQSLVSLVSNFMVAGLGDVKMSGVSIAGQILFVFMVLPNAICAASDIYMTQFSGAKNRAGMRQALLFKLYLIESFIALYLLVCFAFPRQILSLMMIGNAEAEAILDAGVEYMRHGMAGADLERLASACSAVAISRFPLPLHPPKLEEVRR